MRKSTKVVLRGAIAALTISALTVVVQQPAQAAPSKCLAQHVCLYENKDFTGGFQQLALSHSSLHSFQYDNGHALADSITSVYNNTNVVVCYYRDVNYRGNNFCDLPGGYRKNLQIEPITGMNNSISSIRVG
jgi:hypothetical protein